MKALNELLFDDDDDDAMRLWGWWIETDSVDDRVDSIAMPMLLRMYSLLFAVIGPGAEFCGELFDWMRQMLGVNQFVVDVFGRVDIRKQRLVGRLSSRKILNVCWLDLRFKSKDTGTWMSSIRVISQMC